MNLPQVGTNTRGVRAVMYAPYRIWPCVDTSGSDVAAAASYWVSLVPQSGGTSDTILQIGVIKCDNPAYYSCNVTGAALFWAYGGCGVGADPDPKYLGTPPPSGAEFVIERMSSGYYELRVDGVTKASIYKGYSEVECWLDTGIVKAQIACERIDEGDACGLPTDKVAAHGMKTQKSLEGTWYATAIGDSFCHTTNSELRCDVIDTDSVNFWTVQ